MTLFLRAVVTLAIVSVSHCWFFGGESSEKEKNEVSESVSRNPTPFEMQTADEKFLAQAQFVKDLSPLDICHHKVVAQLHSSCGDISEEELGKLSVQLLNCQSQTEGRTTFPCTEHMSLGECTQPMDPTTWNAYQIVSNRARAICYSTRQHQFRMKTEYTVNQLVHTAENQIGAMRHLQEGQAELHEATSSTLKQMENGQRTLAGKQRHLEAAQSNLQSHIVNNLKDLTREKALIAAGHKELADMTEKIKEKLDHAAEKLSDQEGKQRNNHLEILEDLAAIREKATEVWDKIDDSSQQVLQFHNETTEHYKQTLENLERVNNTINYVLQTLQDMRASLEEKINWVLSIVGGTGNKMALLTTVVLHLLYFLLAILSAAFLQTPAFSRLILLLLVPLNAWSEVRRGHSLGFLPMTLLIFLTVAANWVVGWTWYLFVTRRAHKGKFLAISPPPAKGPARPADTQCTPSPRRATPATRAASTPATDRLKSDPSPRTRLAQGLSSPDVKKLVSILENIYNSGLLSPASPRPLPRPFPHRHPEQPSPLAASPAPTASVLKRVISAPTPVNPPPTPMPGEGKDQPREKQLQQIKKQLLTTLDMSSSSPPTSAPTTPVKGSPLPSLTSTPIKATPLVLGSLPRGSKPGTPKRSVSKRTCLASTKSGTLCKLSSMEGSAFCFRHQVNLN